MLSEHLRSLVGDGKALSGGAAPPQTLGMYHPPCRNDLAHRLRRPIGRPPSASLRAAGASQRKSPDLAGRAVRAPPLLVSFSDVDAFVAACSPRLQPADAERIESLAKQGLPPVVSATALGVLFGYSARFVGSMTAASHRYYRTFKIPKGSTSRTIQAPKVALKVIQKWFGTHLGRATAFPPWVHGFVPGRSTLTAASAHANARWILSLDIRDFFPSVTSDRVAGVLERLGYSGHARALLVRLLTINGGLPQGSPASPVLANLAFAGTDEALARLARTARLRYTRYADDLVFSSSSGPSDTFRESVIAAVTEAGWTVAQEKTSESRYPHRLEVHGLLADGAKPRLPKEYRNRLRAMRHRMGIGGLSEKDCRRLLGHLSYAHSIDPESDWLSRASSSLP